MEKLSHKSHSLCYGKGDYKFLFEGANTLVICYKLINRNVKFQDFNINLRMSEKFILNDRRGNLIQGL